MRCPVCKIPTASKEEGGIMETSCPQCRGIWVSRAALRRIMAHELTDSLCAGESLEDLIAAVARTNSASTLFCPECHVALLKEQVHPLIPVQVDRCPQCDYLWFDAGEQMLLLRLYRELMNTGDPQVSDRRKKLDHLESIYQGPLPGLEKIDRDIARTRNALLGAAQSINHANPALQFTAQLIVGSISRMIDWFLSFVVPIP